MTKRYEGSVRELPSGKFQVRYRVERERKTGGTYATEKAAEKALRTVLTEIDKGDYFDVSKGNVTFEEFTAQYLEVSKTRVKESTYRNWLSLLNTMLLPTFGKKKLNAISVRLIDTWWSVQGQKPVNRRNAYFLLSSMFKLAKKWGMVKISPCQVEDAGKDVAIPRPTFTIEHFEKVLEYIPERLHVVLWTAFSGSLRLGEIPGLNRGDYDALTALLTVQRQESEIGGRHLTTTKTENTKIVPLYGDAVALLDSHIKANPALPNAPMFTGEKGGRIDRGCIRKAWNLAREKADLPDMHIHDLRHISLTHWSRLPGVNVKDIMDRGGHKTTAAALRYQHADTTRAQELAKTAEALLRRA